MFINYSDMDDKSVYILKFGAKWCAPCKVLDKTLEELSGMFDIVKVDVEENPELAEKYDVVSVPTTFIIVDGVTARTWIGIASKNDIFKLVESTENM